MGREEKGRGGGGQGCVGGISRPCCARSRFPLSPSSPTAAAAAMEFSELIKTATVESVVLGGRGLPAVRGTLCITSHHLLLSSCPGGDAQPGTVELWLLIRNVDAVEKRWVWVPPPPLLPAPRPPFLGGVTPRRQGGGKFPSPPPSLVPPLPHGPCWGCFRRWVLTSSSPPCLRVQNLGWYQPPRTNGSPRDSRFGF